MDGVQELKKHDVKVVVRCCDPSYGIEPLTDAGIRVVVSGGWVGITWSGC